MKSGFRSPHKLWFVLWMFLATAVLLELVMQLGAYAVHLANRPTTISPPVAGKTVLCVGDSWTHGMGSSDKTRFSYPAVLQQILGERTRENWTVVNGGQSGQNSRDVLARLASQLGHCNPRIVCVLVGRNDYWSTPLELAADDAAEDHSSFRFRWRIPRLIAWVADRFSVTPSQSNRLGDVEDWKPRPVVWPNPYPAEPRPWPTTAAANQAKAEGWASNANGDPDAALAAFERARQSAPEDPETRGMLIKLYRKRGDFEEATEHLDWLRQSWARAENYWAGKSLIAALMECDLDSEVHSVANKLIERFPDDGVLWAYKAQTESDLGRTDDAMASVEQTLQRWQDNWPFQIRYLLQVRSNRVDEAIHTLFFAYASRNDAEFTGKWLRNALELPGLTAERVNALLASFECPSDSHQRLSTIVAGALASRDSMEVRRIHFAHLGRIADKVRNAGAVPVVITYPEDDKYSAALRDFAAESKVAFVDVAKLFAAKLGDGDFATLRSADGHVNDVGYRIMAECVADGLQETLAKLD